MKFIVLTLNLFLSVCFLSGCNIQGTSDYTNELKDCLPTEDVDFLNTLIFKFEGHLSNTYGTTGTESYKRYLNDLANTSFPQDFFSYDTFEADMNKFVNSNFYKRTWTKTSAFNPDDVIEVPPTAGQPTEVYDPIVLNPQSDYITCVTRKNESETLNDYLEAVNSGIDVNPSLVASALLGNFTDEELANGLTRLTIAINFHYQIGSYFVTKE